MTFTDLLNVSRVLFHRYLLDGALESKERYDVEARILLKTRPVWVLRVHLKHARFRQTLDPLQ